MKTPMNEQDEMPIEPLKWEHPNVTDFVLLQAMRRLFARRPDLLTFVFHMKEPRLRRSPQILMKEARALSSGENVLVRVALNLWNQSGSVGLHEIVERLDETNFENTIAAMRILGPKPMPIRRPQSALGTKPAAEWSDTLF